MIFYETYFEKSNINWKPLIWSKNKVITKFEQKNGRDWIWAMCTSLVLGKVYENFPKIKDKYYFMKLTLKGVISTV